MEAKKNQFVVEWSRSQRTWHIKSLSSAIQVNKKAMLAGVSDDYKIVGLFESAEAASEWASQMEQVAKGLALVRTSQR